MGDPGFPVMIGLLAVPVAVLLLVVVLALIGGRWTPPPEDSGACEDVEGDELVPPWPADPWRPAAPLTPRSLPSPSRDLLPAPRPYHPPAPPSASPSYGVLSREPCDTSPEYGPGPAHGQGFPYGPSRRQ